MTQITYIKSSLRHSSAMTTPAVALSQFGLWSSIKKAFKKYAKPLAMVAGIALSIAVPFIAPAAAGFIFGGTALGAGAIGAAIAGAGMGAAAGALTAYGTGQNVLMGAALGGLGGGLGGGLSGFGQTGTLLGNTADAVYGSGMAASAVSGSATAGLGGIAPMAGPAPGAVPPPNTPWNVVTTVPGSAGTVTTAATGAGMSATTKALFEATLKAAPAAIGTLVSTLAPSDVGAATAELQAEMQRLQNSDIEAYNKAKVLYDQLYARYQQIDPVAAAQLAEGNVQMKVAGALSDVGRTVPAGAASNVYQTEAEKRRIRVAGAAEGTNAYTNAYYQGEGAKTQALAGLLTPPKYSSSTGDYLAARVNRAEAQRAGLASDIAGFLTPYALALAPKDTSVTSADYDRLLRDNDRLRSRLVDSTSLTG